MEISLLGRKPTHISYRAVNVFLAGAVSGAGGWTSWVWWNGEGWVFIGLEL